MRNSRYNGLLSPARDLAQSCAAISRKTAHKPRWAVLLSYAKGGRAEWLTRNDLN